jgi:prephenate dehydrogenase
MTQDDDGDGFTAIADSRIAILGLGLMGGSLALALQGRCTALYGIDQDQSVVKQAVERGIVDKASVDSEALLPEADAIILAAPVRAILGWLGELPHQVPGEAIVLDLGSTKAHITRAMQALPSRFDPVGGHPMCGKEKSGMAYADPNLFRGAPFAFTPLERTSPRARKFCNHLANAVGARPLWLDAETHDRWTAKTSHLPYILANALAASTPLEALPLVGPGFRSTARIAASSTSMMRDILATNQEHVLAAFSDFKNRLAHYESLLEGGDFAALEIALAQGAERYRELVDWIDQ